MITLLLPPETLRAINCSLRRMPSLEALFSGKLESGERDEEEDGASAPPGVGSEKVATREKLKNSLEQGSVPSQCCVPNHNRRGCHLVLRGLWLAWPAQLVDKVFRALI